MTLNLHPPVAAFPVAFFSLAVAFEVSLFLRLPEVVRSKLQASALVVAVAAALAVVAAFVSGYQGADLAAQSFTPPEDLIGGHHRTGRLLLFLLAPLGAFGYLKEKAEFHRNIFSSLYRLTLLICFGLSVFTSHLGGELVFKHGAGVNLESPSVGVE